MKLKFNIVGFITCLFILGSCEKGNQKLCIQCSGKVVTSSKGSPDKVTSIKKNECGLMVAELDSFLIQNNYKKVDSSQNGTTTIVSAVTCKGSPQ